MRRVCLVLVVLAGLAVPTGAHAQTPPAATAAAADTPRHAQLYQDGYQGRYLMAGTWLYRPDQLDAGLAARFFRERSARNWQAITVPNAWNANDVSDRSVLGSVGWYRKDFRLPRAPAGATWIVRFESANNRARVWLNGRQQGPEHAGAFLPFEYALTGLRPGVNRLVVRVDSRHRPTDFPPSKGEPGETAAGGWWNYGGLLREVYLRRVDGVDLRDVQVLPTLGCRRCNARVSVRVTAVGVGPGEQAATVTADYAGRRIRLGTVRLRPGAQRRLEGSLRVVRPRLWSPSRPYLYRASVQARGFGSPTRFAVHSGIRSIRVNAAGHLELNFSPTNFRGFGMQEDEPGTGAALTNVQRRQFMNLVRASGATALRSHYPLSPYLEELADRMGVVIWSEVPVYSAPASLFDDAGYRARAQDLVARNVLANGNHPSVMLWSIGNELASDPRNGLATYLRETPARVRRLDPTRPVGLAILSYPNAGCQRSAYAALDVLGLNEYFGWYYGPQGQVSDRDLLSDYLDRMRACYPRKAVVITEFGAEANRAGPAEERGTYAFQQDFVRWHLALLSSKPYLSGLLYWTLKEFKIRPGWSGGNPRGGGYLHQKALIGYDGTPKPAYYDVQASYRATKQYGLPPSYGR